MNQRSGARSTVRLRILIIAHAFPPMNSIASHRPHSWAREWRDLGHEIHVLTPMKHGFDGTMDLQRDLAGIQVHEVPYLRRAGAPGPIPGLAEHGHVARWERLKALTRRVRFALGMFGDLRLLAYAPMLRTGLRLVRDHSMDLIVATSPPEMVFFVARSLSRRTGVPWIADFRDAWFHDMRLHHARVAAWLAAHLNRALTRHALALVTVSRGLQRRLSAYLGREVLLAYNGFFESEYHGALGPRPWGDQRLHVVYTGRIYPGRQDLAPLLQALVVLKQAHAELAQLLRVDIYGFDAGWLRPIVERHHVGDCVMLHGFVSYNESIRAQRAADVLLFLDWTDSCADGMLTGKLFEYVGSGRPVLALGVRRDSEAALLLSDTGVGVTLVSVEEITRYLDQLLSSGRPASVASASREALSRETQARVLLDELFSRVHGT